VVCEYLKAAFEEGDDDQLLVAIGNVAKAYGMSEIARKTNLSRQNLYKALEPGSSPKFKTVKKIVEVVGCKLAVT
jgi:probable addiction module antidote protein